MHLLLSSPIHVIICGRQGIDYGEDEASGELKSLGYRMRAEGEMGYEPDLLVRLEGRRPSKNKPKMPVAIVEKDRTGVAVPSIGPKSARCHPKPPRPCTRRPG
jgi:hypothetical protein